MPCHLVTRYHHPTLTTSSRSEMSHQAAKRPGKGLAEEALRYVLAKIMASLCSHTVALAVNGKSFAVVLRSSTSNEPSEGLRPDTSLGEWLRSKFSGTKLSCREGGCGACAVLYAAPGKTADEALSINSCLRPMVSSMWSSL